MYGRGFGWGMMLIGGLIMLIFWAIRSLTRSERDRGDAQLNDLIAFLKTLH